MPPGRRIVAVGLWAVVATGSFLGPAAALVRGHSQLVASVPAAGDVVASPPAELRLTFSEPIDPSRTSIDLLAGDGRVLAFGIGFVDPGDAYTLVAEPPPLGEGLYTVNWRALSAADGHSTAGTYTFGIGDVSPPPLSAAGSAGSLHAGHDEGTAFLETESRIAGDLGLLVAAGLPIIAWLVLRRTRSRGIARAGAVGLLAGALGAAGLLVLSGPASGVDLVAEISTRTGQLDLARLLLTATAAILALALAGTRPRVALVIVGGAGVTGLVLVALGGHAAAFGEPAPVLGIVVHLVAGGIWISGLLALAWLVALPEHAPDRFGVLVPRFSGVAIVAVGLVAATGTYADWLQTGTLVSLASPYQATLVVKVALTLAALVIGWFNYRAAGRDARFGARVAIEAGLAVSVVVVTGVLASGSPPGPAAPIEIATVSTSALDQGKATFAISPGRPGPTQFTVGLPAPPPASDVVELDLSRLDQPGETRVALRPSSDRLTWVAPGGLLPPNSRFDAAVIVRAAGGVEQSRTRFAFALDDAGLVAGRAAPPIDPVALVVIALVVAAMVGVVLLASGRGLPATDRRTGRIALAGGSTVSVLLAAAIVAAGVHP